MRGMIGRVRWCRAMACSQPRWVLGPTHRCATKAALNRRRGEHEAPSFDAKDSLMVGALGNSNRRRYVDDTSPRADPVRDNGLLVPVWTHSRAAVGIVALNAADAANSWFATAAEGMRLEHSEGLTDNGVIASRTVFIIENIIIEVAIARHGRGHERRYV